MDNEKHEEQGRKVRWKLKPRVIGATSMPDAYALINSQVIHGLFGDPTRKDSYHLYVIKDQIVGDKNVDVKVFGSFHPSLQATMASVALLEPKPTKVWLYLPELKYIIFIQGISLFCMDYKNYMDGDTPIVEIEGLEAPIDNLTELQTVIKVVEEFLRQAYSTKKNLNTNDPNRCSHCFKSSDEPMKFSCSRCRMAYYCDRACQGKHLPTHQKVCTPIQVVIPDGQSSVNDVAESSK